MAKRENEACAGIKSLSLSLWHLKVNDGGYLIAERKMWIGLSNIFYKHLKISYQVGWGDIIMQKKNPEKIRNV